MLLRFRKVVFYLLVVAYFIITPYAILYGLGYIYNPTQVELVQTGIVSLNSVPRGATVFVEGKRFSDKTPALIRNLLPGRYSVRVVHKGFETWEKEIAIYPEKATRLEPVLLMPQKPEIEEISARSYLGLVPCVVDSKLVAWSGGGPDSLWKMDSFFKRETPVEDKNKKGFPAAEKILGVECNPHSDLVLFKLARGGKTQVWPFNFDHELKASAPEFTLPETFDRLSWDPKSDDQLYLLESGALSRVDLRRGIFYPKLLTDVLGFGAKHHRLYVLKKDFSLWKTDKTGARPEALLDEPALGQKIFSLIDAKRYDIEVFKGDLLGRDLVFFLSDTGTLVANRLPYQLVPKGVIGLEYATGTGEEKVLYWTADKIGMITFVKNSEGVFEEGPVKTMLYEGGKNIRQVFWAYEDTHIVFVDGDRVKLLEAVEPGPYLVRDLQTVRADSSVIYQEKNRSLYFLDPANGHLLRRKITD